MLRFPIVSAVKRSRLVYALSRSSARASMVTAAQKRALNEKQLSGKDASATAAQTETSTSSTESPPIIPTTTIHKVGGDSPQSNGGGLILPVTALLAVATGTAYYMDVLPGFAKTSPVDSLKKDKVAAVTAAVTPSVSLVETTKEDTKAKDAAAPVVTEKPEKKKKQKGEKVTSEVAVVQDPPPNRVIQIQSFIPSSDEKDRRIHEQSLLSDIAPQHDPDGHRVTLMPTFADTPPVDSTPTEIVTADSSLASQTSLADAAVSELGLDRENTITVDQTLKRAHALLKGSLDDSFLMDLETLSPAQLRIRVIQLVSEMAERTKWEAVRLKEFLQLKEREVTDRFMEILQKQRLEFEDLLAKRLREREYEITKAANEAIQAKDQSIESLLDAALKTQKQEHDTEVENVKSRLQLELSTKYEVALESKLAALKEQFAKELSEKVHEIVQLKERMDHLQTNLESSRNFESSSQRAHRVSAAALALMEKMESGHGAVEQFAVLKEAASENEVIASALMQIPSSIKEGIPTLSELQASFENVHKAGRQAALIPTGRLGLGGQIVGILLSKVTVPPSPDSIVPVTEESGTKSDYILSCANYYVKIGDLEKAVYELEQLSGQTAYAVKDWKKAALDRIAVEKVLKVIKLECSLLNKSMGGNA